MPDDDFDSEVGCGVVEEVDGEEVERESASCGRMSS